MAGEERRKVARGIAGGSGLKQARKRQGSEYAHRKGGERCEHVEGEEKVGNERWYECEENALSAGRATGHGSFQSFFPSPLSQNDSPSVAV